MLNEWQVAGIRQAMRSMDRGEGIPHQEVKRWLGSLDKGNRKAKPKSHAR